MTSCHCQCDSVEREHLRALAYRCGATAAGFARVAPVDSADNAIYDNWLAAHHNAAMTYAERNADVRRDPARLLDGARSLIVCTFSYEPTTHHPYVADYALGDDYHDVLRRRLDIVARHIHDTYCADTRICVDTAPLRERYWAVRAGIGYTGRNGLLIVPGHGSAQFIGTIITTLGIEPDVPTATDNNPCTDCDKCVKACPAGALDGSGGVDARRCLSYLTIEHRSDLPHGTRLGTHLYGCDTCRRACPLGADTAPTRIDEFAMRPQVAALTPLTALDMTPDEFAALRRHSAMSRIKLAQLQRNAHNIIGDSL